MITFITLDENIFMSKHYPLKFVLEDGVHVEVDKTGDETYQFILTPVAGAERRFEYVEQIPRDKIIDSLDFDQLNAVRRFWLEQEKMD